MKLANYLSTAKQDFAVIKKPESENYLHLDVLRFIAAIGIVFFHYIHNADFGANHQLEKIVLDNNGFRLFVDIFFMISGFIIFALYHNRISNSSEYYSFMKKRIARLIPLHFITLFFFIIIGILISIFNININHPESYDNSCIIPNLLMIHSYNVCNSLTFNGASWSISAEMGMYLLAPIFIIMVTHIPVIAFFTSLIVIAILFTASNSERYWFEWTFDFGVIRALPSFILGMVLFKFKDKLKWIPFPSFMLFTFLTIFILLQPILPKYIFLPIAYSIVLFAVAADSSEKIPKFVSSTAWLGRLTYSVYMIHGVISLLIIKVLSEKLFTFTGLEANLMILLTVILLIPISFASLILFEMPMRRWITNIGRNKKDC